MTTLTPSPPCRRRARTPLCRAVRRVCAAAALRRQRRALRRLDDHLLRDIGLTRHEAEAEAAAPAWDVPPHWRG